MKLELDSSPPPRKSSSPRRRLVLLLIVIICLLLALLGSHWALTSVSRVHLVNPRQTIRAQMDGPARILLKEGSLFSEGQILVQINAAQYKLALEEAELMLTQAEALLPPGYALIGNMSASQNGEGLYAGTTAVRLQKLQAEERALQEEVEAASLAESRAAVEERRTRAQRVQVEGGAAAYLDALAAAEKAHNDCRRATVKARFALEEASLARAAVEHENRRITRMQQENMSSQIPEATRMDMYALQNAKRDLAKADYEAANVKAPFSGVVEAQYLKDGEVVTIGEPILLVAPTHQYTLTVTARTKRMNLPKSRVVTVTIPGYNPNPFAGTLVSTIPDDSISGIFWLDKWLPESLRTVRLMVEVPILEPGPVLPEGARVQLSLSPPKQAPER